MVLTKRFYSETSGLLYSSAPICTVLAWDQGMNVLHTVSIVGIVSRREILSIVKSVLKAISGLHCVKTKA